MQLRVLVSLVIAFASATMPAFAQAPAVFPGKVRIASTAADALCVGATTVSPASTACLGGLYVGPIVSGGASNARLNQSFTNTTSGTAASAGWLVQAGTSTGYLEAFSQGFTSSGSAIQSGVRILAEGAGGLTLATSNASATIDFYTNSTLRWRVNSNGNFLPTTASTLNLGGPSNQIATVYSDVVLAGNGSAGAPSHSFYNDTDIGMYRVAANSLAFSVAATRAWGIVDSGSAWTNSAGNLVDVQGTPSVSAGGGSGAAVTSGMDYSFIGNTGSTASTTVTVTLSRTYNNAPSCSANLSSANAVGIATTTTTVVLTYASVTNNNFFVQCRGF